MFADVCVSLVCERTGVLRVVMSLYGLALSGVASWGFFQVGFSFSHFGVGGRPVFYPVWRVAGRSQGV